MCILRKNNTLSEFRTTRACLTDEWTAAHVRDDGKRTFFTVDQQNEFEFSSAYGFAYGFALVLGGRGFIRDARP